jgi:hypothetical protein
VIDQLTEARRQIGRAWAESRLPTGFSMDLVDKAFDALLDFPTDEQVEAGARAAWREERGNRRYQTAWENLTERQQENRLSEMRAALEAARDTMIGGSA